MTERSVAIIGKGMIGISMAVLFTGNRIPTIVLAKNAEVGLEKYRTYYRDLIDQGLVTERQAAACERRLSFTESYQDLADVEVVFECVTEKLAVKYEVYRQIEANCPHLKAIASTTSAISPEDLAKGVAAREKVMVTHPYNPPHIVPCVELVKNDFTDPEALEAVSSLLEHCGREVRTAHKTQDGKYLWTYASVKNILVEESYTGVLVNHRSETNSGKVKWLSPNEWYRHEGFFPVIVSKKQWEAVQRRLKEQARPANVNKAKHRYAGLLTCRECGNPFVPMIRYWRGNQRVEYVCRGYHRNGKSYCSSHRIHEET